MNYPKLSIVTVNLNQAAFLEETILSVINQKYPNLEYIIIDGGSTDGSLDIIKKYESQLAYWVSEKDEGAYHAVQKGFEKSTGDIMAWINSDDFYLPNSFLAVAEIFNTFPDVKWLMGIPREYTAYGALLSRIELPWARWSKFRYYTYDFQFIQQESSFWKREVWEKSGASLNLNYKYAGDMELWLRFFKHYQLHTTLVNLSGFRHHSYNQRSVKFRQAYLNECKRALDNELKKMSVFKRLSYFILRLLGYVIGPFFFYDIPLIKGVYSFIYRLPKPINYDFYSFKFSKRNMMVKLPPLFLFNRQIHWGIFNKKK